MDIRHFVYKLYIYIYTLMTGAYSLIYQKQNQNVIFAVWLLLCGCVLDYSMSCLHVLNVPLPRYSAV